MTQIKIGEQKIVRLFRYFRQRHPALHSHVQQRNPLLYSNLDANWQTLHPLQNYHYRLYLLIE